MLEGLLEAVVGVGVEAVRRRPRGCCLALTLAATAAALLRWATL